MVKTMNRIGVWTVIISFCFIQFALADQLVTSGDYAFLADGDLKIYNIVDPKDTDPEVIPIGNASAVAVSGNNAVVTINNGENGLSIQIVDISDYVDIPDYVEENPDTDTCDPNEYLGTFDMEEGVITLPGVTIDDTIYTLIMERRGKSNNWQITFSEVVADSDDTGDDDTGDDDAGDDDAGDDDAGDD